MYTNTDSCSICVMFCNSSLASFIVGAWEKQLLSFVTSLSSVNSSQDKTTCRTAPADFLKISVLKSLLLALQAWLILLIQSSKACLFVPSKILIGSEHCIICFVSAGSCQLLKCFLLTSLASSHHLQGSELDICQFHQRCTSIEISVEIGL